MSKLCLCPFFDNSDRLLLVVIDLDGNQQIYKFMAVGAKTTIHECDSNRKKLSDLLNSCIANDVQIVTSDFKTLISQVNIELVPGHDYNVFDLCLDLPTKVLEVDKLSSLGSNIVSRMRNINLFEWMKVFANAAIVYQSIENRGVNIGYDHVFPKWSQKTYSGRSKTLGINIQGSDGSDLLRSPKMSDLDKFAHLDWTAADLRIAAVMSGDRMLQSMFDQSDPYTALASIMSDDRDQLSRDECKIELLKAINSLDYSHPLIEGLFPELKRWMHSNKEILDKDGSLTSIMGRKFKVSENRSPLSVINGVMQGSIAHAMQLCIKMLWDLYGDMLLLETHDSVVLVVSQYTDGEMVRRSSELFIKPFARTSLSCREMTFPVKVSIGSSYGKWEESWSIR